MTQSLDEGRRNNMHAIVETGGKQFKVTKDEVIHVPKVEADIGARIELDSVLLLWNGEKTTVGAPHVPNAKVIASVLAHKRDAKVVIFKMKRRKGYRKKQGHRQDYTELLIQEIIPA